MVTFSGWHCELPRDSSVERRISATKDLPAAYGLDIPVGHAGPAVRGADLGIMDAYRTPGTPWTVIIDREGVVQFNFWGLDVEDAINLVDLLRVNSTVK
jgi:hypothetical protein